MILYADNVKMQTNDTKEIVSFWKVLMEILAMCKYLQCSDKKEMKYNLACKYILAPSILVFIFHSEEHDQCDSSGPQHGFMLFFVFHAAMVQQSM